MRFRLRIGPFTFGRSGARLSLWSRGTGISVPLSKKKGRSFGKVSIGPVRGYFGGFSSGKGTKKSKQWMRDQKLSDCTTEEAKAIEAFGSDQNFLNRLRNNGVPWRGVQERIKESLPKNIQNRDDIAYRLVPKAMDIVFGQQNTAWKTEKRPSKSGRGLTTWIVIINDRA